MESAMQIPRTPPLTTRSARKPRRLRLMRSSWIKLVGTAIDPRARDAGAVLNVSDFDAKRGLMVRSEAVAFAAISMSYRDPLQHKMHFEPKSTFEENAALK
jgi:hypothetical protein